MVVTDVEKIKFKKMERTIYQLFFNEYYERLCLVAFFILKQKEDAEDIVMNFISELPQKIDKFNGGDFNNWLIVCIKNEAFSLMRRKKKITNGINFDQIETSEKKDFEFEDLKAILTEEEYKILNLYYLEGYKYKEIIKLKAISKWKLNKIIDSAIKKITNYLKK